MDLTLGTTPQGMPGMQTTLGTATTETAKTEQPAVPRMDQPAKDQMTKSDVEKPTTDKLNYSASSGVPVLDKPQEEKTEKTKDEKTPEGGEGVSEMGEMEIQAEQEIEPEQDQEGQQGGGQGGGEQGSDAGSGSFSGGGNQQSSENGNEPISIDAPGVKVAVNNTTTVNNTTAPQETSSLEGNGEGVKTETVNPLDSPTKITSSGLFSPPVNPMQFFVNEGKLTAELVAINSKFVETLPEGPEKMRYSDFLRLVQTALAEFQQLLREMKNNDATGAQDRTKARLETTLAKIEIQRKEQQELAVKQKEAEKKQQVMGPLMAIFAFLLFIMLAAVILLMAVSMLASGPQGWLVLGMLCCAMVDEAMKVGGAKPFLMKKFVDAVCDLCDKMIENLSPTEDPAALKAIQLQARTMMTVFAMYLFCVTCPAFTALGGFTVMLSFMEETHIVRDNEIQKGKTKEEAELVAMYVNMAIGAAFAVAAVALAFLMPASIGSAVSSISKAFTKAALTAAQTVTSILERATILIGSNVKKVTDFLNAVFSALFDPELWVSVTSLGLQTTVGIITYKHEMLLADIALIQGRFDSEIELKEATIMMLKKVIKQLLEGLQGIGDDITKIGEMLKKSHSDVSSITTNLFA